MKSQIKPIRFLLNHFVFLILLLGTEPLLSQSITSSQGSFVLIPPGELVDSTAARSAKRVAELAMAAVTSDAEKLISQDKEIKTRGENYDQDNQKYGEDLAAYNAELATYNTHLKPYEDELATYSSDLSNYDASLNAYNALPGEQRDTGTYNYLMGEFTRLDNWHSNLDSKKAVLDNEFAVVMGKKSALDVRYNDLMSRYNQMDTDNKAIKAKLGTAYRQLEQINQYAMEINKLLEKWQEPVINTKNLNTPLEQLKALSNKGWD